MRANEGVSVMDPESNISPRGSVLQLLLASGAPTQWPVLILVCLAEGLSIPQW